MRDAKFRAYRPGPWLAFACLLLLAGDLRAQEATPPAQIDIQAVLQRMEKLEKQNEELRKELEEHRQLLQQSIRAKDTQEEAAPVLGDKAVRDIVKQYLQDDADQKKKEEERKKKEANDAGFEVGKDLKMTAAWRDGVWFETADKAYRFTVGGRVDFDNTWYNVEPRLKNSIGQFNNFVDPNVALDDGSEFRRARLRFQGTVYEIAEFNCEYDFAHFIDLRRRSLGISPAATVVNDFEPFPATRLTDLWLGINQIPWIGTLRAGHQKEWISFTNATSGRFLTFIERPLIFEAFNNEFQFSNGFSVQNNYLDDRMYVWAGMFRTNTRTGGFDLGDGDHAYSGRVTFLPVWLPDYNTWVHVGADYSYRNLHFNQVRFRDRALVQAGAAFQVPNIVDTGNLFSRAGQQVATLEFASAWGPLTLTGEYMWTRVADVFTGGLPQPPLFLLPRGVLRRGNYQAEGFYVECLCFLTGDHRGYRREQPSYDRIRPRQSFFLVDGSHGPLWGCGAWEIGLRYDYLDLSDDTINGGILHALTFGLNWYLNPNMKVQANYVWMDRNFTPTNDAERVAGSFHSFAVRYHWDF